MKNLGQINDPKDIVTKEYVDNYVEEKFQGENTVLADNSFSAGFNNIAGGKAFKIIAEPTGTVGGTGTYKLDSVTGIQVGMTYSAVTSIAAYHQGTIQSVNSANNTVTVNNYAGYALNTNTDDPDNYNFYNTFLLDDHPELGSIIIGHNASAFGQNNIAHNVASHVEGKNNNAIGKFSHVEGLGNIAGHTAHAEGTCNKASGDAAHAEGRNTKATQLAAHAEGDATNAFSYTAHAEGYMTEAGGEGATGAHAEGVSTKAQASGAHTEGEGTIALGKNSHSEGNLNTASGGASHAEGKSTTASGSGSHAEGKETIASSDAAHAEGYQTKAKNQYTHAEGCLSEAAGWVSHAEGMNNIAKGAYAHAEGNGTQAIGAVSHTEGENTVAETNAKFAHVEGRGTIATTPAQHVQGKFNVKDTEGKFAHIIGGGTADDNRFNIHTVDWNGNAWFATEVKVGGTLVRNYEDAQILATREYVDNCLTPLEEKVDNIYTKAETDNAIAKMTSNAILYTEQNLTEEQKAQARANIGAISKDEENIITEEVEYHYDGNTDGDRTLIKASNGAITFVKIAPLPEGELNLIGSRVSIKDSDPFFNANFEITEEMLTLNADKGGVIIPAVEEYRMTQIFYKRPIDSDLLTYVCICERPGTYKVAFYAWYSDLYFPETGIYVMDGRDYSKDTYVDYINTSITFKTQNGNGGEIISTSPAKYKGNEIQVFNKGICIGDSITEGYFDNDAGNTIIRKYSYPTILSKLTGIDIVNSGVSGFTSKQWYDASIDSTTQGGKWVNGAWVWNLYPQVGDNDVVSESLDYSEFDFAIIHLGINDTASNTSVEEIISTFNSSINGIISNLKTQSKGIKIFLATIIPYRSPIGNVIYEALNEKIREIANSTEDVYLIDLNIHSECFENTPYGNGYHLTAIGYHKMASEISSLISYTINQNLEDFKWVQFIGTNYTP